MPRTKKPKQPPKPRVRKPRGYVSIKKTTYHRFRAYCVKNHLSPGKVLEEIIEDAMDVFETEKLTPEEIAAAMKRLGITPHRWAAEVRAKIKAAKLAPK